MTNTSRRAFAATLRNAAVATTFAALASCGGNAGPTLATDVGTGGTGMVLDNTSLGPVSGFGSIWVNGVRYDDSKATVRIDDAPADRSDIKLGMYVRVDARRDAASTTSANASAVTSRTVAAGIVSSVSATAAVVQENRIQFNALTIWDGLNAAAELRSGDFVRVWGYATDNSAAAWIATRVQKLPVEPAAVFGGAITQVRAGGVTVGSTDVALLPATVYDGVSSSFAVGQRVRIAAVGTGGTGKPVQAGRVSAPEALAATPAKGEFEVTGLITTFTNLSNFSVGNIQINASAAKFEGGTAVSLAAGVQIEVEGTVSGGILNASKVELKDGSQAAEVEVEGEIQSVSAPGLFRIRGQDIDGRTAVYKSGGSVTDLVAGRKASAKGTIVNQVLIAREVEVQR